MRYPNNLLSSTNSPKAQPESMLGARCLNSTNPSSLNEMSGNKSSQPREKSPETTDCRIASKNRFETQLATNRAGQKLAVDCDLPAFALRIEVKPHLLYEPLFSAHPLRRVPCCPGMAFSPLQLEQEHRCARIALRDHGV